MSYVLDGFFLHYVCGGAGLVLLIVGMMVLSHVEGNGLSVSFYERKRVWPIVVSTVLRELGLLILLLVLVFVNITMNSNMEKVHSAVLDVYGGVFVEENTSGYVYDFPDQRRSACIVVDITDEDHILECGGFEPPYVKK